MKTHPAKVIALALMFLITSPTPHLIALGQETNESAVQEKQQAESEEAKKLRKAEESKAKKEDEQKRKDEKKRAEQLKGYQTLSEFAEDLYASNPEFRDQVNDTYLDLQRQHAFRAYIMNTSRYKELIVTENEGEVLELRRTLYNNPRVQEYVNRLGQQIVPEDSEKLYSFKVILDPIPRADTLSTGTILISTGMISLLDNEAQLAYVLAHELAHVYKDHWRVKVMLPLAEEEYNKKQENKRKMWAGIIALAGAGVGASIGGKDGIIPGALGGLVTGYAISSYYAKKSSLDWNMAQENEADDFALKATLGKSFDIQEVPRLYATLAQVARTDKRAELGFLGSGSRIKERIDHAKKVMDGALQTQYQEALQSNKIKGVSPEFNLTMSELKRDNGIHAFYFDMLQLAKRNLEQSVAVRSDDPIAAYYYGRVMKVVGRTKEELDSAQHSLMRAISLDTRQEIPEVQLHRALLLMDSKDSASQTEAMASLKNYITLYGRKRATSITSDELLPPNLDVLYGYMRLLGDKTWTAPTVMEILKANTDNPIGPITPPAAQLLKVQPASQALSPTNQTRP